LDRASGYEPEGRQFESVRAHHKINELRPVRGSLPIQNPFKMSDRARIRDLGTDLFFPHPLLLTVHPGLIDHELIAANITSPKRAKFL
jgi:hypothetical protein